MSLQVADQMPEAGYAFKLTPPQVRTHSPAVEDDIDVSASAGDSVIGKITASLSEDTFRSTEERSNLFESHWSTEWLTLNQS